MGGPIEYDYTSQVYYPSVSLSLLPPDDVISYLTQLCKEVKQTSTQDRVRMCVPDYMEKIIESHWFRSVLQQYGLVSHLLEHLEKICLNVRSTQESDITAMLRLKCLQKPLECHDSHEALLKHALLKTPIVLTLEKRTIFGKLADSGSLLYKTNLTQKDVYT